MTLFSKFSLRNPIAIIILILLVIAGGLYSSTKLKQELMVDTTSPAIFVNVVYPGASAQEVLNTVTNPLETAIRNVEGVQNVTSSVANSMSFTRIDFDFKDDLNEKKSKIEEAANSVQFPTEVQRPNVIKNSPETNPVFISSLLAKDGLSAEQFQKEISETILPAVKGLPGVGNVQVLGLTNSKISITLDPAKLSEQKLTYQQVVQILQAQNMSNPLGEITINNRNEAVTISGAFSSVEQIGNLLVSPNPELRLKDIGKVEKTSTSDTITSANGKSAVAFNVMKTQDANTADVTDAVKDELEKYADKISVQIIFDSAVDIKESVDSMVREGALGAVFASLLILFFLRNIRVTLIAIVSIPISILITMVLMKEFNLTLNIMTLGGMAVATGRVVDDSIVVIENIIRRMQTEKISQELILSAVKEVAQAITSSTLTTIAVFAPLGLLSGPVGRIFGPFALTVVFALLSSLLVSVTVVPMLSYLLMRKFTPKDHEQKASGARYKKALAWTLNHKFITIAVSILLLVGSLPLAGVAGVTFLPSGDEKMVALKLTMPKGTDMAALETYAKSIDEKLLQDQRVSDTQLIIGNPRGGAKSLSETNVANWTLFLKQDADLNAFITEKKDELKPTEADTTLDVTPFDIIAGPGVLDINVTVNGPSKELIRQGAEQITEAVKSIEGTDNVKNNLQDDLKEVTLQVRTDDALKNGLTTAQATQLLRPFLTEQAIGKMTVGNQTDKIYLQVKPADGLNSVDAVSKLELITPQNKTIQVKDIADVKETSRPATIMLLDSKEYASVTGMITLADKAKVNKELQAKLKSLTLPDDVTYSLGGSNKQINDMLADMGMAILIAIGMVYIVMVVAFNEGKAPFAILFSIPFALIGVLLATVIAQQPISLATLIGILMLIGIVVTNAIVLLDRVKQQMKKGMTIRESLLEAGGVRLRPILMTAFATMFALVPLALGLGKSILISQGLAVAVIGGLITSTFLTLFIVPIMFEILNRKRVKAELSAGSGSKQSKSVTA
ncbi:cation:proton antiporter [Tumebacillus algifaecis]|uniref:Cation:proton antiporter n=1 Tax=Tumebacillus algifaecis TaxID=1214604 RepID=A0A223CXH0_9BACL|nr:efflux RND transporter permease subunit [Tumebacillus algifaecis]ASS73998.1 cation:proton antiporter [Tumebacillus algifaecis]